MNYYNEIKTKLLENENYARIKDYSKEKYKLDTYYEVGKILSEDGKHYGEVIIKEYSNKLTKELGKGYTQSRLRYIRRFYEVFSKCPTLSDKLSYSHYCEIIWLEEQKINYYITITQVNNLTVRELRQKVKNKEYERLDEETKIKLTKQEEPTLQDFIKNPLIIKNKFHKVVLTEKTLKEIILESIDQFLLELGEKLSYIGNEYKIKIGDRYNYIDILLYNIKYKCYVIIELKITELKKEYIGQIETYMNYINKNIKSVEENNTIGIIICKKDNIFLMEYCSDPRILSREYILN